MRKNIEESKALLKMTVNNYREAATLCNKVADVIKAFDGKIFNVKLSRALQEKTGQYMTVRTNYVKEEYIGLLDISMRFDNRSIGNHSVEYDTASLCHVCVNDKESDSAPIINKRIVAANIVPSITEARDRYLDKADELIRAEENVKEWMEKKSVLTEQLEKLRDEIPDEIQNYYNLQISYDVVMKLRMGCM